MKESLKLAVELAKRGESEGIGTVYRETCADVYFRARLMMGNRVRQESWFVKSISLYSGRSALCRIRRRWRDGSIQFFISLVNGNVVSKGIILEDEKTAPSWEGQEAPETPAERQQIVRILKPVTSRLEQRDGLSVWRITTRDGAWKSFPAYGNVRSKSCGESWSTRELSWDSCVHRQDTCMWIFPLI